MGGLVGATVGLALGALIGVFAFDRTGAIWASVLGAGIFGFAVGMLILGYSSLESPDAGSEPSDTARPIADRPEAVREERPQDSSIVSGGAERQGTPPEDEPNGPANTT